MLKFEVIVLSSRPSFFEQNVCKYYRIEAGLRLHECTYKKTDHSKNVHVVLNQLRNVFNN